MERDQDESVRSENTTERTEPSEEQVQDEQKVDLKEVAGVVAGLSRSLKCSAAILDIWLGKHGVDPDTAGSDPNCA